MSHYQPSSRAGSTNPVDPSLVDPSVVNSDSSDSGSSNATTDTSSVDSSSTTDSTASDVSNATDSTGSSAPIAPVFPVARTRRVATLAQPIVPLSRSGSADLSQPPLEPDSSALANAVSTIIPEDRAPPPADHSFVMPSVTLSDINASTSNATTIDTSGTALSDTLATSDAIAHSRASSSIINASAFSDVSANVTSSIITSNLPVEAAEGPGGVAIALIGGIVAGVVLILLIGGCLIWRRRKAKKSKSLEAYGNPYAQHP